MFERINFTDPTSGFICQSIVPMASNLIISLEFHIALKALSSRKLFVEEEDLHLLLYRRGPSYLHFFAACH